MKTDAEFIHDTNQWHEFKEIVEKAEMYILNLHLDCPLILPTAVGYGYLRCKILHDSQEQFYNNSGYYADALMELNLFIQRDNKKKELVGTAKDLMNLVQSYINKYFHDSMVFLDRD